MSNDLLDGGPAFPQPIDDAGTLRSVTAGMTLRHWTATESLSIAVEMMKVAAATGQRVDFSPIIIAKNALLIADALIREQRIVHTTVS